MSVLLRQAEINLNSAKGLRTVQDGVFFPVAVVSLAGHGGRYISKASVGENPFWNETFVWRIDNRLFESNMQILVEIFQSTALEAHVGTSSIELQSLVSDPTPKTYPVVVYGKNQGILHVSARISPPFKPEGMPQIQDPTKSSMHMVPSPPPPPLVPSLPRLPSSQNGHSTQVTPYAQASPEPYRVNESFQSPSHSTSPGSIPPLSKSPQLPSWKSQNLNQMLHQKPSSLIGIVSPFDPSIQKYGSAQSNSTMPTNEADNKVQQEPNSNSNSNNSGSTRDSKGDLFKSSDEAVSSKLDSSPPSNTTETSPQPNTSRSSFSIPRHRNVFSRSSDSIEVDSASETKSDAKSSSVSRMSPGHTSVQPSTVTQSRGSELNRRSTDTYSSSPQRSFKSSPSSHSSTSRNGGMSRDRPAGLPSGSPQRSRSTPNPQPYHGEYGNGYGHGSDQLNEEGRFVSQQHRSSSSPLHSSVHSRHASNSSGDENGTSFDDNTHSNGHHGKYAPQKFYPSPSHSVNLRKDAKSNATNSPDRTRSQTESSPASSSRRSSDSPVPHTPIKSFKQHPTHASPYSQSSTKQDAKYLRKSTTEPTQSSYNGGKTMSSKMVSEDRNLPHSSESKMNQHPSPSGPGDNEPTPYRYGESPKPQSKSETPPEPSANAHNYPPQQPYPQPHPHSYSFPSNPYPQPYISSTQPYPAHAYPPPGQQYPPPGQQYPPPGQQYPPPGQQYPPPAQQYPPNFPQAYPSPGYPQPPHPAQPYVPQPTQGHSQHSKSSSGLAYGSSHGSGHGYGNSKYHDSYKSHGKGRKSHGMGEMGAGLAVGALAGAVGGLALAGAIDGDFIPDVVDGVGDAFGAAVDGVGNVFETAVDGVDDAFDATVDAAFDIW